MQLINDLKNKYINTFIGAVGIIFLSSGIVNVFNLIFWLYMVRKLSTVEYGILNSLFSLFMIISLPIGSLQTVVTKFVSQFSGENSSFQKIRLFLFYLGKRILIVFGAIFILFLIFSPNIASFMKIPSVSLIIVTGIAVLILIISPIPSGTLQGLQLFPTLAVIGVIVGFTKLAFSITLVALGYSVMGAMLGLILSSFLGLIITVFKMPKELFLSKKNNTVESKILKPDSIFKYFIPVTVGLFCFIVLTNIDIILVKHYFSPLEAGYYSVAQMVGKIILFLPIAICVVMFPKIVDLYAQNKNTIPILKKSLTFVSILSFGGVIISILFPQFILNVLTGKAELQSIPLVPIFALAMGFFALVSVLMYYHLSIHNYKFILAMVFFTFLQIILIAFFHKQLIDVLYILLFSSIFLFSIGMKYANIFTPRST